MPGCVDRRHPRELEVPLETGIDERCDHRPGSAVDVDGDVDIRVLLEGIERVADLFHRLVGAVEGRAQDRDDANRVLIAKLHCFFGRKVEAVALHRHESHLDVPVVRELLPAHLDVDSHDEVRLVGWLPVGCALLVPAPLERKAAQHRRLTRAGRGASRRVAGVGCVPQPAQNAHAAHLELCRLRVLVLVNHVLVEALGHEPFGLGLHPRAHERRHVEARVPVEHQLVVDDLVGKIWCHLPDLQLVEETVPVSKVKSGATAPSPVRL